MSDFSFLADNPDFTPDIATRTRLVTTMNRYMADRPDAVQSMVLSNLSNEELIDSAGSLYAAQVGDGMLTQLQGMTPATQRSVFGQLTKQQQMALGQMGYSTPQRDDGFGFGDIVAPIAGVTGAVIGGIGNVVKPVAGPALEKLAWVGNWPGHLYRTIRMQDGWGQVAAGVFGVVGGIGALALAAPTGGGSLLAFGAFGLGALGAGSAAAAIVNPGDWMRAFDASWDGERTFKPGALRRVDEMLGDPRLSGLAQDLAQIDGFSLSELAMETASARGGGEARQMAMIEQLASRMGGVGTPQFQQAAQTIFAVTQDATFQEAVRELQRAKYSPGRDIAGLFHLDPDSTMYNVLSGGVDFAFTIAVDPTIMLGGVNKIYKARTFGLALNEGSNLAEVFADVAKHPKVLRGHEAIVNAMNAENIDEIWRISKSFGREAEALMQHRNVLKAYGGLVDGKFTVKQLHEYMLSQAHNTPLLRGVGSVNGTDRYILESWGFARETYQNVARSARAFTDGMGDEGLLRKIEHLTKQGQDISAALPAVMTARLTEHGSIIRPELYNQGAPLSYMAGRYAGKMPGMARLGEVMTAMTTMAPANASFAVNGPDAARDMRALSEMGRSMNMPSYARRMWRDSIIAADSNATRVELINGWFDNALTMSGVRELPEGDRLVGEVLERFHHAYGADDFLQINGRTSHTGIFLSQQADRVLMPDLKTLIKTVRAAHLARFLDVLDVGVVETAITKVWKPAVLLRLAFIPRAAGEEFLAWTLRGGLGGLVQELSAQGIGKTHVYDNVIRKLADNPNAKLTASEEWVRKQGPLANIPAYLRPVVRMMSAIGWGDPMVKHLETFGRWQRDLLAEGFGGTEDAIRGAIRRGITGVDFGPVRAGPRLNIAENVDTILLGNPYSWRRMLFGGVDSELVRAADQFYGQNGTAMWRATSAINSGPVDTGHDQRKIIRETYTDRKGNVRTREMVTMRGSPTLRSRNNDPYYASAVHHNVTMATDDVLHKAAMAEIRLIRPVALEEQAIFDALQPFVDVNTYLGRKIIREFTDEFNPDTWRGLMGELQREHPLLARELSLRMPASGLDEPDLDLVIDALRAHQQALIAAGELPAFIDNMLGEVIAARSMLDYYRTLDPGHRSFLATQVDDLWNPTSMTHDMLKDFVNGVGEELPGPSLSLFRGMQAKNQFKIHPNGDLELFGMPQDHWNPAHNDPSGTGQGLSISFSSNREHARSYAEKQGEANLNGFTVEVDANHVYGETGQPKHPTGAQGFAWAGDQDGGFGAYYFGQNGEININLQDNVVKHDLNDPAIVQKLEALEAHRSELMTEVNLMRDEFQQFQMDAGDPVYGLSDDEARKIDEMTATLDAKWREVTDVEIEIDDLENDKIRVLKQESIIIPAGKWKVMANQSDPVQVAAAKDAVRAKLVKFDDWYKTLTDDELEQIVLQIYTVDPATLDLDVEAVLNSLIRFGPRRPTSWQQLNDPVASPVSASANPDRIDDWEQMAVRTLADRQGKTVSEVLDALDAANPPPSIEQYVDGARRVANFAMIEGRLFSVTTAPDFSDFQARLFQLASDLEDVAIRTGSQNDLAALDMANELVRWSWDKEAEVAFTRMGNDEMKEHFFQVAGEGFARDAGWNKTIGSAENMVELKKGVREGFHRDFAAKTPLEFFDGIHEFDKPTSWGTRPSQSPFHKSWDDAAPHIQRRVRDALNDPNNADSVEHSLRQLADDPDNLIGQYNAVVKAGSREIWSVDDLTHQRMQGNFWNPSSFSYEDVLQAAPDEAARRWIIMHRQLIEETLATGAGNVVSSSRELVQALDNAAGYTGKTGALIIDRQVMAATLKEPKTTWGKDIEVWDVDDQLLLERRATRRTDDADSKMEEWASLAEGRMRQLFTARTRQGLKPKVRPGQELADGTIGPARPLVFHDPDQRFPVGADELITEPGMYYDHKGRLVPNGSLNYFDQGVTKVDEKGEVMWALYGPASRDADDAMWGRQFYVPQEHPTVGRGRAEPTRDVIPAYRSQERHVTKVGADQLPSYAIGETLTSKERGGWDKFVSFGFDRVIGPALDSIVRNPMAFHHFSRRFIEARKGMSWLMSPEMKQGLEEIGRTMSVMSLPDGVDARALGRQLRDVAVYDGLVGAENWKDAQALAWMRGHTADEFDELLARSITRADAQKAARSASWKQANPDGTMPPRVLTRADSQAASAGVSANQLSKHNSGELINALGSEATFDEVLTYVESQLPPGALDSVDAFSTSRVTDIVMAHPVLKQLQGGEWEELIKGSTTRNHINTASGEFAQITAINDIVPFLDSHEFKTQFAEYGKGMLPFWYAEENFMKRWARGLINEGPAMIRKAQLGYMGLKEAGVVRTDENGRDWFVYPGSGLLIDTISRIWPGLGTIAGGIMFQTPTDSMFPGLSARFGQPSFTPLATLPLDLVTAMFPELEPIQRAALGDFSSSRNVIQTLIPTTVTNFYESLTSSPESNPKYAAAVTAALAQMDAAGQIPDNLTPMQVDELMDRARDHGRIILFAQMLTGFTAPGPPSALNAGETASFLGIGAQDPSSIVRGRYLQMVRQFGIEQGTINFMETFPDATLEDVVNPMAFTQARGASASGAPISSTEEALAWYDINSDYLNEFPDAGPWLLPMLDGGTRTQFAYNQVVERGLRVRKSPEEFFRAMKFRTAAGDYFAMQRKYNDAIALAGQNGDSDRVSALKDERDYQMLIYRAAHPIFSEELQSSDGRERRARIIEQMRIIVKDPEAPRSDMNAAQLDGMITMIDVFDDYKVRMATLSNDRSANGRAEIEFLKQQYADFMERYTATNPKLMPFWNSVLEPESSLS